MIGVRRAIVALWLTALVPALGLGQTPGLVQRPGLGGGGSTPPGPESALFRLGPVGLSPRIALTNVGIDTNVYNSPENPVRDVTATFIPGLDSVLRVGRTQFAARTSAEFVYFREATSQRSSGFSQEGRVDVLFEKLTPFVSGGRLTTHQRPNAEIDQRVRQVTDFVGGGVQIRSGARVTVDVEGAQGRMTYGETQADAVVAEALNRRDDLARLSLGVALTPLTTLRLTGESLRERFEESAYRDTDSVTALAGFEFRPFALISGSAMVGLRHLVSKSGELADFTGVVAAVDVVYVWREMTRLGFGVTRDVEPSVESVAPYYVLTDARLSITQALGLRWDVVGRGEFQTLDYQRRVSLEPLPGEGRRDRADWIGAGVGFRARPDFRVGFDVDHVQRSSALDGRTYKGYRLGGSVTYGLN